MGVVSFWDPKCLTFSEESPSIFIDIVGSIHVIRHSPESLGTLVASKGTILAYICHVQE